LFHFFFQAEDGIRDRDVTGVQTCALPISDVVYFPEERLGVIVLSNQGMLFPNLAQTIASYYLPVPGFLRDAGIPDEDPKLTNKLRSVVDAMAAGTTDPSAFSGEVRAQFPASNDWLALRLSAYGRPQRFVLLEESRTTDTRTRSYRAVYGQDLSLRWRFVVNAGGLISDYDISAE